MSKDLVRKKLNENSWKHFEKLFLVISKSKILKEKQYNLNFKLNHFPPNTLDKKIYSEILIKYA